MASYNTKVLRRKITAYAAASPRARKNIVAEMGLLVAKRICENASGHTDTNRNYNGWAMAGGDIGAGTVARILKPSKYNEAYKKTLHKLVEKYKGELEDLVAWLNRWYPKGPPEHPKTSFYSRKLKRIDRLRNVLIPRAQEAERRAMDDPYGVLIGGGRLFKAKDGSIGQMIEAVEARKQLARIFFRAKVYGGRGEFFGDGRSAFVRLHNLEPHASMVEARYHDKGRAMFFLKSLGVKSLGKKAAVEVRRAFHGEG